MARQSIFIGSRYLGSREVPNFRRDATFGQRPTESWAYFCQRCGDLWARFLVENSDWTQCYHIRCAKHGDGRLACDSRFEWLPIAFDDTWPEAAVRYEFEASLNLAIKELSQ